MEKSLKQGQVETFSQAALILDPSLSTKYFFHLVVCILMMTCWHASFLLKGCVIDDGAAVETGAGEVSSPVSLPFVVY